MKVRNLGKKGIEEIENKLHEMGLSFLRKEANQSFIQVFNSSIIKKVNFSSVDGLYYHKTETCVSINDNGKIIARKSDYNGHEDKYCTFEISTQTWGHFIEEAVIINDILNWEQEYFEWFDIENYIHTDTSYSVEFVLEDKTLKFKGGISSRGIKLIWSLFEKYFEPPFDVQYTTETIEDVF